MLQSKNKISIRQAMLMCIVLEFAPAVRLTIGYSANAAKQAAWLSGILSGIPALLLIFILNTLFNNKSYKEADLTDVIKDVMGNIFGRIIIMAYFIWIMFLLAANIRFFIERMVGSVMPNTSVHVFGISMIVMVGIALSSGITVLARMSEIIVIIILFVIYLLFLFGLPLIKIENLTPIYFTDIFPAFLGSVPLWSVYGYMIVFFFFGSQINDKEKITKFETRKALFLLITNTLMKVYTIGALGWSLSARIPRPYFAFVKIIAVFGVVERLESVLVIIMVLSDFIIISIFSYAVLSIIKNCFGLSDYKFLIIPFMTLAYFLSLIISKDEFQLEQFTPYILATGIFLEYIIPTIIIIMGKLRKKI